MTENEAIEILNYFNEKRKEYTKNIRNACPYFNEKGYQNFTNSIEMAMSALYEIQQYRAIGTVEECREARERQKAKKYKKIHPCKSVTYYQCPRCDGLLHVNENFCGECGQAILWEEEDV